MSDKIVMLSCEGDSFVVDEGKQKLFWECLRLEAVLEAKGYTAAQEALKEVPEPLVDAARQYLELRKEKL